MNRLFADSKEILLGARKADSDIGSSSAQKPYGGPEEIIRANFSRVQESLRVLEEYSRAVFPGKVPEIKKLRFRSYTLEKKIAGKYL